MRRTVAVFLSEYERTNGQHRCTCLRVKILLVPGQLRMREHKKKKTLVLRVLRKWQTPLSLGSLENAIDGIVQPKVYTGLFISPSGISELDCGTTKTDTAERSISIGRESLQVFFVLGALAYFQVPPLGGSREEKWRSQ